LEEKLAAAVAMNFVAVVDRILQLFLLVVLEVVVPETEQ
jgi:hypothetical protein